MPAATAHLQALRLALRALLACQGSDTLLAHHLGLTDSAARALRWWRQPLAPRAAALQTCTLGFDADCPSRLLPRCLRSPLDGTPLPVRAVRSSGPALAHTYVKARNQSHDFLPGSLGAVLRSNPQPARLYALTAGHVFGAARDARMGDEVRLDYDSEPLAPAFGTLLDWQPRFAQLQPSSSIDAAIAEIDADALHALAARPRDWPTGSAMALGDDRLRLRTRGLEISGSELERGDITLSLGGDDSNTYQLSDILSWLPASAPQGGDSGAPLWNADDALVAIHAGADSPESGGGRAYAVPIGRVLRWADAEVVRRGETLARPTLASGRSAAPQPAVTGAAAVAARSEADVLARTLYGEARGEGAQGMAAVGHVVFNRVAARSWWGRDVTAVCLKPWQFSCWNHNDPNRAALLHVSAPVPTFRLALDTASALLAAEAAGTRAHADPTGGATHYFAPAVVATPRWAIGRAHCARIGRHLFFKGVA